MEGFSNSSGKDFITIVKGKFTKKVKEGTPGAKSRINKNNDEVWELQYDKFEGKIMSFKIKDGDYGKELQINLIAGSSNYTLAMGALSDHAFNFYNRMENINYQEPVSFQMWSYDNPFFAVLQGDGLIARKYTKEEIPRWEEKEIDGKKQWSKTPTFNFFLPKIDKVWEQMMLVGGVPVSTNGAKNEAVAAEDDLPF